MVRLLVTSLLLIFEYCCAILRASFFISPIVRNAIIPMTIANAVSTIARTVRRREMKSEYDRLKVGGVGDLDGPTT